MLGLSIKMMVAATVLLTVAGVLATTPYAQSPRAVDTSLAYFKANRHVYGIDDPSTDLRVRRARFDANGETHVRYSQLYQGVPVFEGEAIAHVTSDGHVSTTSGLRRIVKLSVTPTVSRDAAIKTALANTTLLGAHRIREAALWVMAAGERSTVDRLVWQVAVRVENEFQEPAEWRHFIDGHDGSVVWSFNAIETTAAKGIGKTMYSGTQALDVDRISTAPSLGLNDKYFLRDLTRGAGNYTCDMSNRVSGSCTTISRLVGALFGNSRKDSSDRATAGADAHFGLQTSWTYYKTKFGRAGINGTARRTFSRVHYGSRYENAFWDDECYCMTYGDGDMRFYPLVSLDVAGHELSHGVTESEANLTYAGESGGLNESTSDIFATMIEFFANTTADVPDYWIGERIERRNYDSAGSNYRQSRALRYMDDPAQDGRSPACWYDGIGSLNVHYSSGPNNHMYYLLSHGGTSRCTGQVVVGIGNDKAARIWYKALTDYMLPSTDYHSARNAALNAAGNLYGGDSREFSAVLAAFAAINVR